MGRKNLANERREEILAAFERCIGRYGIDAPLERIADEAGVQRSLIRHYLGNRDELVDQVIGRIAEEYPRRVLEQLGRAAERGASGVLDALFPGESDGDVWEGEPIADWDAVINAVVSTAQGRYPQAKQRVARMMEEIVECAAGPLQQLFPGADPATCYEVAYGLLCLVQSHESLLLLGLDAGYTALARRSAEQLLEKLARPAPPAAPV